VYLNYQVSPILSYPILSITITTGHSASHAIMAIMGKWRIGGRKQSGSSGENEDGPSGTVTPDGSSEGQELTKAPSRFLRTLRSGLRSSGSKQGKERDDYAHLNQPFSQTNLEHQKLLSAFAWNFGKRRPSHGGRSSISGISPSASRNASVDSGHFPPYRGDMRDAHPHFSSSLIRDAPQEVPGEESDREQGGVGPSSSASKAAAAGAVR
jgi:hypothetical protein